MKIIIYFGHHKVGSTALQSFLARNAIALLRKGILYPAVESQGLSHLLSQALTPKARPDLGCMNLREPHNALAFRMMSDKTEAPIPPWHAPLPGLPSMLRTITHQVDILSPHTLILCSEVFSNFGAGHRDLITRLRSLFPDAEYELYCTLRRPDEYAASWFGQRLRFGHKMAPLSAPKGINYGAIHFDYRKMVEPWVDVFQGCRIHIRNYADVLAAGGSIADFTTTVSCTFPRNLPDKGPKNPSLPRAAYEILRRANHELPAPQANTLRQILQTLPLPGFNDRKIELFGAAQRQKLADNFAPIHDYLSQFASDSAAFFPDIEQMRQTNPVDLSEATRKLLVYLPSLPLPDPDLRDYLKQLEQSL